MQFFAAPVQGYTDAEWRRLHAELFGGVDRYFTPFIRVERGEPRARDLRGAAAVGEAVPQVIFRDLAEFRLLVDALAAQGHKSVDLNLGCPFPPQVKHGRGAALLRRPDLLVEVARDMSERYPSIGFSVKMRLGVESPDEWRETLPALREMPLRWLTVHPRTARQQYGGELHMDSFGCLLAEAPWPVVYNGDLTDADACREMARRYPTIAAVMAGRGLLSRPCLAAELATGTEWDADRLTSRVLEMHFRLLDHYEATLCGEAQVLAKIKPFWDYLSPLAGHRPAKAIRKSTTLTAYLAAVRDVS